MRVRSAVVVGAGVVGASAAYRLAARGVSVTVLEAGEPAGETSSRSFAWLNGNHKPPLVYQRLNQDGVEAHRRLRDELGRAPWLHESGALRFALDGAAAEALIRHTERLRSEGYPAEVIDAERARQIEPRVQFGDAKAFAYFPREGWAHGPTMVRTLLGAAREKGARVLIGTPATGLDPRRDGVRATTPGEAFEADVAVIAAGRFTDQVAALASVRVPLRPTCGLLAVTSPLAEPPRVVVHAADVHWRPEPDGRLVIQDDETDEMVGPDTHESPELPACAILLERARRFIPALADARIEAARVGIRPMPEDGYPIVGRVPGVESIYLMVTHSGMTLSAVLGEVAAAELVDGQLDERLAAFRPDRYLSRR